MGVIFDEKIDFKRNAENLSKSGGRALGSVISKIHSMKEVGFKTYEKLYYNCVAPVLDYCSGVWGYANYHQVDMVQNRAIRYFLGIHRFTPILAVQGEIGWPTSFLRHQMNMIRLWNHIVTMDDERIIKKVFCWDRTQVNRSNWSTHVKNLMDSLDMTHHYSALRTCDLDTVDSKLRQQFHTQWLQNIQDTPKLRTYKLLKNQYKVEKYVELNLPKNLRSSMAMFRCGVLPLRIETGRYKSEPIEDRICVFCNLHEIETEKHFLLHCSLYNQLRDDFFRKIQLPDQHRLTLDYSVFVNTIVNYPRQTANFIFNAFQIRQQTIMRK